MRVFELNHVLGLHCLTQLRNKNTSIKDFRRSTYVLGSLLLGEATRKLEWEKCDIDTPLAKYQGIVVKSPVFIPILRAGLSLLDIALNFFPDAKIGMVGAQRDEKTAESSTYYQKFPEVKDQHVFILEPMLATGGTLISSIQEILLHQPKSLAIVSIVAAQQGIEYLSSFENVALYTGAIDASLNQQKYIVPGLGDFGDRWSGTQS
ncbi:MAG: uracil phosphoribosyltransferase [Puniceicoccales bacterium]|jgi:uracil phosphoribosyltransferase|nr:uracil phosphoribosyltransferase [Puniceicoccales bacterium]